MSHTSLGRFTKQLKALSNVLLLLYPDDTYFKKAETYLELGLQTNPRLVHTLFVDHVMKFKDEILEQNDAFFLDYCEDKEKRQELLKKGSDIMQTYNASTNVDVMDTMMERCSVYWNQLEDEQKSNIWKYLKVLVVLAERV